MKKQDFSHADDDGTPLARGTHSIAPLSLLYDLLEIGNLAIAEGDQDQILRTFMDIVISIYRAKHGLILLFDEEGNVVCEAAYNLSGADLAQPEFEVSRTLIDQAQRQGELMRVCPASEDFSPFSALCLPLKHDDQVFGILYLDHQMVCAKCEAKPCVFFREFADLISSAAYRALEHQQHDMPIQVIETELRSKYHFEEIVGHHPQIVAILKLVAQVADTDATVLIQGESGTGKELIARALHENSRRKDKPLIPVNCGALPEQLLESELFGHVRGAFTGAVKDAAGWFERAEGGTIFLDEVNDMSPALQVKLLRVLQTGEYSPVGATENHRCDVRVIAATSKDLQELVKAGRFREEVYYRLNIIDIHLPPLCERKSDIPLLARHFMKLYGTKYDKKHLQLSREAETLLLMYDFPGQIRELENLIQRAVILAEGDMITPEHLTTHLGWDKSAPQSDKCQPIFQLAKKQVVEQFERSYIVDCLRTAQGNITHAAEASGIHVTNLHAKMKKYRIHPQAFKS